MWHVRGRDVDLVVDTSLGLRPMRHLVERELGHDVLAVATHVHADHVGGMHEFDRRAIHPSEAERLADAGVVTLDITEFGPRFASRTSMPGTTCPTSWSTRCRPVACVARSLERLPAPATMLLDDGDVVDLGDRVFEVLHLPGHSEGSIGLWEPASGVLFSGDAVYDGPLLDELDGCDIPAYVDTMRRLRDLPVTVVHGGHEPSFGRERLVELCDAYLASRA